MNTMIENIDLKNLDKSSWETFRFDEIAQKISERVKPDKTDLKIYVGLEHLDPESVHIKRTGVPADVKGEKLKCYPGDVIFGKRRAYQRKAAIATFEGICSGHSFVFRANSDVIDPKLFPFFLHSDQFMHRMIDISVGGLSPTINWGNLKDQEFLLPPKAQQGQLAELLWRMDEVVEKEVEVCNKFHLIYERYLIDFFEADLIYPQKILGDFVKIISGNSPSKFIFVKQEEGVPFYKVKDMNESFKFQNFSKEWVVPNFKRLIPKGALIFPKRGAAIMTNKVRVTTSECHADTNVMALIINTPEKLMNEFLYYFLYYKKLYKIADTSQIPQINNVHINPYPINLPPLEIQLKLITVLNDILQVRGRVEKKIQASKTLQKSLINQIF
jgi:restriction endonuclease S subunit